MHKMFLPQILPIVILSAKRLIGKMKRSNIYKAVWLISPFLLPKILYKSVTKKPALSAYSHLIISKFGLSFEIKSDFV